MPLSHAIKNLAQVCLGDDLENTPMEGSTLSVTISFLQDFLTWAKSPEKKEGLHSLILDMLEKSIAHTSKPLGELLDKLNDIQTIDAQIASLYQQFQSKSLRNVKNEIDATLIPIAQYIVTCAQSDTFFPGGWRGDPGHSMIYRLTMKTPGQYVFQAYNTGAGINYHGYVLNESGKKKYYPVYGVSISADQKNLEKWIVDILKPQILPLINCFHFTYSEKEVYALFESSTHHLSLSAIPNNTLAQPIQTQRSGTCTFKSIEQVIRTHFDDHLQSRSSFRLFLLAYRLYLFQQAIEDFDIRKTTVPGYHILLERVFSNIVRMLDTDLSTDKNHWDIDFTQLEGIFSDWNDFLQSNTEKMLPIVSHIPLDSYSTRGSTDLIDTFKHSFDYQISPNDSPQGTLTDNTVEGLSFYDALMQCVHLVQVSSITQESCGSHIERFCFNFSKDEPLLNHESQQHPDDIFNALTILVDFYQKYRPRLTPRSIIIHLSLMSFMDRVCEEKLFVFRGKKLSCVPFFNHDMEKFIKRLVHNPFLSTQDARLDLLLLRLKALYTRFNTTYSGFFNSSWSRESDLLKYYCDIVAHSTPE